MATESRQQPWAAPGEEGAQKEGESREREPSHGSPGNQLPGWCSESGSFGSNVDAGFSPPPLEEECARAACVGAAGA